MQRTLSNTTQRESIKQFLLAGNTITPLEALSLFGAYRLAAHVEVLRDRGYNIVTTMNTDHTGRRYARYHIPQGHKFLPAMGNLHGVLAQAQGGLHA